MAASSSSTPNSGEKSKTESSKSKIRDSAKPKIKKSKSSDGVSTDARSPKPKQKPKRLESDEANAVNKFPMERVRRIIRSEDSDVRVTNEAVFLVNKATEKFLEEICGVSHACCVEDRKKSLSYNHLSSAVSKWKRYDFISDFVPVKVRAEDALAEMKSIEPESA